jgi:hypothetical protein
MKLPDDPQMNLSSRALGCGCRGPGLALVTAHGPGARPPSHPALSPLSEPADTDPDPGPSEASQRFGVSVSLGRVGRGCG